MGQAVVRACAACRGSSDPFDSVRDQFPEEGTTGKESDLLDGPVRQFPWCLPPQEAHTQRSSDNVHRRSSDPKGGAEEPYAQRIHRALIHERTDILDQLLRDYEAALGNLVAALSSSGLKEPTDRNAPPSFLKSSTLSQGTVSADSLAYSEHCSVILHKVEAMQLCTFGALSQEDQAALWHKVLSALLSVYASHPRGLPSWLLPRHIRCIARYLVLVDCNSSPIKNCGNLINPQQFPDTITSPHDKPIALTSELLVLAIKSASESLSLENGIASWIDIVADNIQRVDGGKCKACFYDHAMALCASLPSPPSSPSAKDTRCDESKTKSKADEMAEVGGSSLESAQIRHRFHSRVQMFRDAFIAMWEVLPVTVPSTMKHYGRKKRISRLAECRRLKGIATKSTSPLAEIKMANRKIAALMMGTSPDFLGNVLDQGLFQATTDFVSHAEDYDKSLNKNDLFQASRNAWTAFALQLLYFPNHVGFNRAIQGYSMLYPYSDNYLDDPSLPPALKRTFLGAFREWLAGVNRKTPANGEEKKVFDQVRIIETELDREQHPNAYHSLVAILDAQAASLTQHTSEGEPAPAPEHILDVTVFKGGTSVLADSYMGHAPSVRKDIEFFSFAFGVALQLVDDIQDVLGDRRDNQHTIFTLNMMRREASDAHINKLLHMLEKILHPRFSASSNGIPQSIQTLREEILQMTYSMVLKSVIKSKHLFTATYLRTMEEHAPLPLSSLVKVNSMRHLLYMVQHNLV